MAEDEKRNINGCEGTDPKGSVEKEITTVILESKRNTEKMTRAENWWCKQSDIMANKCRISNSRQEK